MTATLSKPPAIADAEAAVLLIEKNKLRMALPLLRGLPAAIEAELVRVGSLAWLLGFGKGRASVARQQAGRQPAKRRDARRIRLEWLREKVADSAVRERAQGLLGLGDALLERVLAGACDLGPAQWRRLRRGLDEPPRHGTVPKVRTKQPGAARRSPP